MKRRNLLFAICIVVVVGAMVAAGCAAPAPAPTPGPTPTPEPTPTKTWDLTFTMQHPIEQSGQAKYHKNWVRMIEAKTNGAVKITIAPSSTLAAPPDNLDAVKTGLAEMGCQLLIFNPGRMVLNEVTGLPLLFQTPGSRQFGLTHKALLDKYPEMQQEWERENVHLLAIHANGPAQVLCTDKQVRTMEDLNGMVMIAGGTIATSTAAALGCTPEVFGPDAMYDALAKGVVDGQFLEWEGCMTWHLNEVINYATEASLWTYGMFDFINYDTWNSLTPEIQKLLEDTRPMLTQCMSWDFDKKDLSDRQLLEEQFAAAGLPPIYVLPDEERARWVEAAMPQYEVWVQNAVAKGGVSEATARAILADAIKFADQYSWENYKGGLDCESVYEEWVAYPRSSAGY